MNKFYSRETVRGIANIAFYLVMSMTTIMFLLGYIDGLKDLLYPLFLSFILHHFASVDI